jgi:predicted nucleotidyltransferase
LQAREGDLIKTKSNVVFDVKGLVHPEGKVIAFPRFIPVAQGPRHGKDSSYGKVYSLGERFKFLQENLPDLIVFDPVFGETMCEVHRRSLHHYVHPSRIAYWRPKHCN